MALHEALRRGKTEQGHRMSRRRVVITGIGPITCVGHGRENFWNGILAEKSGINSIASFDPSAFRVRCAGEIRDWDPEAFFPPHRLKRLDRYAQFAVASAKLALDDAQFEYSREKPKTASGSVLAPHWVVSARPKINTSD